MSVNRNRTGWGELNVDCWFARSGWRGLSGTGESFRLWYALGVCQLRSVVVNCGVERWDCAVLNDELFLRIAGACGLCVDFVSYTLPRSGIFKVPRLGLEGIKLLLAIDCEG